MATKPIKQPRWGATSPGVITGTIVEPSEAKKDVAFVVRERPPSQFIDWLFYTIYTWIAYLADGNFSGASTFDSTLGVTGALSANGGLAATTITASSTTTLTGALATNGGVSSALTVTGLITGNAGVTCAANQSVTVSGTGVYHHPVRTLIIGPGDLDSTTSGFVSRASSFVQQTGGTSVLANVSIETGKTITELRAYIRDNATGTTTCTCFIEKMTGFSGLTQPATTNTSTGAGTDQTLTATSLSIAVTAGSAYTVTVVASQPNTTRCYRVEIDYIG